MLLEDYEIVCPLNSNLNPTINSYKAKKKLSDESYILHSIDFAKFNNETEKEKVYKLIKERKEFEHPNLLKFITTFEDQPFKILYVVTEYCHNGNASTIISNCVKEKKFITEELICKIIYQIVCAIKTVKVFMGKLVFDEIFLDDNFNVKLLNFQPILKVTQKSREIKVHKLARIMYQFCTLKKFEKLSYDSEIKKVQYFYSTELLTLLNHMLKDHNSLHKNIDKILCNTTILLKSSQWHKDISFFIFTEEANDNESSSLNPEQYLQKLKEKEKFLQIKETFLNKKEQELRLREKKLVSLEKSMKNNPVPTSWNDLDSSLPGDCGDSVIVTTTKKLNDIVKPSAFIRSKSERKVKFKGHSPLRNYNYGKKISKRISMTNNIYEAIENEENSHPEKGFSDKSSTSTENSNFLKTNRNLFTQVEFNQPDYKPISWNGESKRQAFELLRIMNGQEEMKHTYL